MKKFTIGFFCIIVFSSVVVAQDSWIQKTCMFNYGRHVAISFSIDSKAYVGLGAIFDGSRPSDFWEYDSSTNKWIRKADFPGGGRYAATAFAINGKGYVCLGIDKYGNNTKDLWEYDPSSNKWSRKADFPDIARYGASCFIVGDSAFVGTGSYGYPSDYLYDLWMYVPNENRWYRKADFPGRNRCHATAFSIGDFGYMGTGLANDVTPMKDFWKYNPRNDSWSTCSDLPTQPRLGCIGFAINGKGFIGMGYNQICDYNDFFVYDPIRDSWSPVNVDNNIIERRGSTSFVIGKIGFFCTGETKIGLMPDLWAFSPNEESNDPPPVVDDPLFTIFPNPSIDYITIVSSSVYRDKMVSIYNVVGQEVLRLSLTTGKETIDISKFAVGTYLVKIRNQKKVKAIKFVKDNG